MDYKELNKMIDEGMVAECIRSKKKVYYISRDGRVYGAMISGNGNVKEMSYELSRYGYPCVKVTNKTYVIHKLVALAFIPNPNNYKTIRHVDWNKMNNNAENLEWGSQWEEDYMEGY